MQRQIWSKLSQALLGGLDDHGSQLRTSKGLILVKLGQMTQLRSIRGGQLREIDCSMDETLFLKHYAI